MQIKLHTNFGSITISLDSKIAPNTVNNFLEYVNHGFFDGTIFHRVIANFMIQGGGFIAKGTDAIVQKEKTSDLAHLTPIQNEAYLGGSNLKGTIAMARTMDPHSASSQFFINLKDNFFLNHESKTPQGWGYCVFGKVIQGMEIVEAIGQVKTTHKSGHDDVPVENVLLESIEILEEIVEDTLLEPVESAEIES